MTLSRTLCLALLALSLVACAGTPRRDDSLYRALGEREGIARVVDSTLLWVLADARINELFSATDPAQLAPLLVDQICEAAGGPCTYTGRTMEDVHTGLNITEAQFGAFVENLIAALDEHGVSPEAKAQLLAALGSMQSQVVGR
jgi:hemoglobin